MSGTNAQPKTIGPYHRLELLGVGGMGVVYRAVHGGTGQAVALKTVRVPQQEMLKSLRREIHALARIRHPDIVRILDEGLEDGMPWYAMELLEGAPLRRYCAGSEAEASTPTLATVRAADLWWTHSLTRSSERRAASGEQQPEPITATMSPVPRSQLAARGAQLVAVLTLVRRLCAPLSFLHGEGIVHRDLKPENVLVRPDGYPVLVDFGLAARFAGAASREFLEVESGAAGTLAYIAPEALYGEAVDARADLYSLGCIFYELLTGRRPFVAATAAELIRAQLHASPVPPSQLAADLPEGLDDLVLRLLAKSPRQRLGYADDVAAALGALGAEDGTRGPRPRPYLYRPDLAGREEPLSALEAQLAKLEAGTGGLLLLGGESGVGKTRLVMELGRKAERRMLRVLAGECLAPVLGGERQAASDGSSGPATEARPEPASLAPGGPSLASSPLQPLRRPLQAMADRCRSFGVEETERLLGRHGKLLSLYEPAFAGLPGQESSPEPVALPPEAALLRLNTALTRCFMALAEDQPLLLLLDDLQWADELTLGFLRHLLSCAESADVGGQGRFPILVIGTFRSEEVGASDGRTPLWNLLEAPGGVRLQLGRLDEPAVGALVGDMLALASPPATFVRFLWRHSEGNPFFLAEYLRVAIAEGVLLRAKGLWQMAAEGEGPMSESRYKALPLPHSLRETVERRLLGLSAEAQRLVWAAAVLGREMDESLLLAAAGIARDAALEPLQELQVREVLQDSASGQLRFVHDKLREVAYGRLGAERRCELHRTAAEAIVRTFGEAPLHAHDQHSAELGHHWEQAGVPEKARACYLAAARTARGQYALKDAEELYRAYLRLVEQETAESIEARNETGYEVLYPQGRIDEARLLLEQALTGARQAGARRLEANVLGNLGWLLNEQGQLEKAWALYEQGLAITRQVGDRLGEGIALNRLGVLRKNQGQVKEARTFYEQAIDISREIGDRRLEEATLGNLGWLCGEQGQLEEAWALYEQAFTVIRQRGDRMAEAIMRMRMGVLRRHQGQVEEAQALYEQAIAVHREIGNRRGEGRALGNLAVLHLDRGQLAEAWALFEQTLAVQRQINDRPAEALTLGHLGLVRCGQGRQDEARTLYERALAVARSIGDRPCEGTTLGYLGDLLGEQGLVDEALDVSSQALAVHRETGNNSLEGWVLRVLACQQRRTSPHPDQALELARASIEILRSNGRDWLPLALAEQGHALLAAGKSAAVELQEVLALSRELGRTTAASECGRALARLEWAQAAFEAGTPLFRGERWEDIPEGLRRWLIENGQAGEPFAGSEAGASGRP